MANTVESAFIRHFQAEVHQAYQRQGSKLRATVRSKSNIKGATTVFQKVGKGTASTKARHGKVPVMSIDHEPVECNLLDYYAGDWVDALDEIKLNIDERMVVANAGAYALVRKTDELIILALDGNANLAGSGADGLTKAKVLEAFELLGAADVPTTAAATLRSAGSSGPSCSTSRSSPTPTTSARRSCPGRAPRPSAGSARCGCRTPASPRTRAASASATGTTRPRSATLPAPTFSRTSPGTATAPPTSSTT